MRANNVTVAEIQVSIPYKRVTNEIVSGEGEQGTMFQSPISGSQTRKSRPSWAGNVSFNPL